MPKGNKRKKAVIFLTIFIDLLGFGVIIPLLPLFSKSLGATDLEIGLLAGVYSLMNFLFSSFFGTLSDRFGRKPVLLATIALNGLGYIVFGEAQLLWVLFMARILAGIGSANLSTAQAYLMDITPSKKKAQAMGMIGAAFGLGFTLGPLIGGVVKANYGIEMVGYFTAGLCALNFVLALLFLPESIEEKNNTARFNFKPISNIAYQLKRKAVSELFYINFIFITAFSMMQVTAVLLWEEHYHLNEEEVGYVFAFIGLTAAIVQGGLVGRLNAYFGEKKLIVVGVIFMMIGLLGMPFAPVNDFKVELIFLLLIALANGCLTPNVTSLISQYTGVKQQGKTLGANESFRSVARIVGPILGGYLYGINFHLPYIVGPVLLLLAVVVALRLYRYDQTYLRS